MRIIICVCSLLLATAARAHVDYLENIERAKRPARERCLQAAHDFHFKGRAPANTRLSDMRGRIVARSKLPTTWFSWDGERIIEHRILNKTMRHKIFWTRRGGVFDANDEVIVGTGMEEVIAKALGESVLSDATIRSPLLADRAKVKQAQFLYERCKNLPGQRVWIERGLSQDAPGFVAQQELRFLDLPRPNRLSASTER